MKEYNTNRILSSTSSLFLFLSLSLQNLRLQSRFFFKSHRNQLFHNQFYTRAIYQFGNDKKKERKIVMHYETWSQQKKIDTYKYLFVSMAFEYLNVYEFFNILAVSMYFQICNFRSVAHIHYDLNSSSSVFSILTFHSTFD